MEIMLKAQPVLYVSSGIDVFLLPAESRNEEAGELYHRVTAIVDEVCEYTEAMQGTPLLHTSSLDEEFHPLADFDGAVLTGRERENVS